MFGKVFSDHMLEIDWDDEKVRGHGEAGRKNRGGGREEKREGGNEGGVWQERSEAAGMSSIEAEHAWIYKSLVFVCRSRPVYPPRPPSFPLPPYLPASVLPQGWHPPRISPFHPLSLSPAASVLHYALECFEGMKAFKDINGRLRLFRPDLNMARLNTSLARLYMPVGGGGEGGREGGRERGR